MIKKISREQMSANSVVFILLILKRENSYGYSIMSELKEISNGTIVWKEGSLYPVLQKMEKRGYIKSYWNVKDFDRPRKYYQLQAKGKSQLNSLIEEHNIILSIIDTLQKKANN